MDTLRCPPAWLHGLSGCFEVTCESRHLRGSRVGFCRQPHPRYRCGSPAPVVEHLRDVRHPAAVAGHPEEEIPILSAIQLRPESAGFARDPGPDDAQVRDIVSTEHER